MKEVVILSSVRTAGGAFGGSLKKMTVVDLGVHAAKRHPNETNSARRALAPGLKFDDAFAKIEIVEPDHVGTPTIELNRRRIVLLNQLRGGQGTLPSPALGDPS